MKKTVVYIIAVSLFAAATGYIIIRFNKEQKQKQATIYPLVERKGVLQKDADWEEIKGKSKVLINNAARNSADNKSRLALIQLYLQEARITGNYSYYDMAAMKTVNDILRNDPGNFEALTYKAMIFLSQHHFSEGLEAARELQKINPYNSFVYGLLVDGNVETGNYSEAVENADKMVSIRPDIRSYSRISYLREIHGDYDGAIEAMKLAVDAGIPGSEGTEWARVQLGRLYENTGNLEAAKNQYFISLQTRPSYPYALAGMARMAAAAKDYRKAIGYYWSADSVISDYSFKEECADIYMLMGEKDSAMQLYSAVINEMEQAAEQSAKYDSVGHYSDLEMAQVYLKLNKLDKALEHAFAEYNRRPGNIEVNETVAWIHYRNGNDEKALQYLSVAMKTRCRNPTLLNRAGLIYARAGEKSKAKSLLEEGLRGNPNIAESLKEQSIAVLRKL
ncbi:MAG: hypothetical protein SFU87_17840 [Chitinophagaceae bacterium]|nr:hypothetical protein [Chitinophagaceae bacterium]